eukprot:12352616-Alexandrium_andersonii.AAC.1
MYQLSAVAFTTSSCNRKCLLLASSSAVPHRLPCEMVRPRSSPSRSSAGGAGRGRSSTPSASA